MQALTAAGERPKPVPEVRLGGREVLTCRDMMRCSARLSGRRPRPLLDVPVLTPRLSSRRVAPVTPVGPGLVQPPAERLGREAVVHDPAPPGTIDAPMAIDDAVRAVLP